MLKTTDTHHIIVAEESTIVREGLLQMLCRLSKVHVHVVAVSTMHSLEDMLKVRPFHMVFASPSFDGGFDMKAFRLKYPELPCVAIVSDLAHLAQVSAYVGYITIHSTPEEVGTLILTSRESTAKMCMAGGDVPSVLSIREKEVLVELAKGYSNKEVAANLNIALYTVTTHRRNICQKLNIHSVAGLTIYALAHHLIDL